MASAIDPTKPVAGNPTTESVRLNFAAAKSEIEVLQQTAGVGPQGPIGPTGPAGTIAVGTVTTGAAGSNATVTNSGTSQAATLNFTIPRGDAGTGGSGITETQAVNAVRQGNPQFLESPESTAGSFPTTPNAAGAPVVGDGWTPTTGTATQAYTHDVGTTNPLAYPASIASGSFYQVVFSMTNVTGTSTVTSRFFSIYLRTGPTATTGQQIVAEALSTGMTLTVKATGNFSHVVVVPVAGWQGNFTMTRVVAFTGEQNSVSLSVKDWMIRVRGNSAYIGGGGVLATGSNNLSLGSGALASMQSASNNIALGNNALARSTDGHGNTVVGSEAMALNMTGGSNTVLGANAFQYAISGNNNTVLGKSAMAGQSSSVAITGSGNTAVGYYALMFYAPVTKDSSNSVGIGYQAGWDTVGSNNVAVGYNALAGGSGPPTTMTGSNTVAVGYQAARYYGSGSGTTTSFENSIFLGANTRPQNISQTNQIVIGYNAEGHGSDTITLGNDSIAALHCQVQTISALSDSRVKEDIQPADLSKCLDAVKNLPVSRWAWAAIAGVHKDKHVTGFMADDLAKVFPKAITKEDSYLTVRNADGTAQMTTVSESVADNWQDATAPRHIETRQIEKTTEMKDLQYVCLTEALPTLWGAVQKLIQKNEELEKQLAELKPSSAEPKPTTGGGAPRRR